MTRSELFGKKNFAARPSWPVNGVSSGFTPNSQMVANYYNEIYIPTEAVSCKNVHCSDENHIDAINKL